MRHMKSYNENWEQWDMPGRTHDGTLDKEEVIEIDQEHWGQWKEKTDTKRFCKSIEFIHKEDPEDTIKILSPWLKFDANDTLIIRFDPKVQERPKELIEKLNSMIKSGFAGSKHYMDIEKTAGLIIHPGNIKKIVLG